MIYLNTFKIRMDRVGHVMAILVYWMVLPVLLWLGVIVMIAAASGRPPGLIGVPPPMRLIVVEQVLATGLCLANTLWVAAWLDIDLDKLALAVLVFCGVHLAVRMILNVVWRKRDPIPGVRRYRGTRDGSGGAGRDREGVAQ